MGKKDLVRNIINTARAAATPAERAAAATMLNERMVQVADLLHLTLPPTSEREVVRVTIMPPENVRGKWMRRHAMDDNGNRYDLAMEVLHRLEDRQIYDGYALPNPIPGKKRKLFVQFDAAGTDAVLRYNQTRATDDEELMGPHSEPLWRQTIARGRPARCIVEIGQQMKKRGDKFAAGKPRGVGKLAMVPTIDSNLQNKSVIMVMDGESPNAVHGKLTSEWVEGMILNPLTDTKVSIQAAEVIPVAISEPILGRATTEIDPDSIFGFGRWWMDNAWENYIEPAKARGVEIPADRKEARVKAITWWSEHGQVALSRVLNDLEAEVDRLGSIHTRAEAYVVLGLPPETPVDEALKIVDDLRKSEEVGETDPIIAWIKKEGIEWASQKAPIARKARKRLLSYVLRGTLNRPPVKVEIKVSKKASASVDAWGLLRPNGRDETALAAAFAEGRDEADGAAEAQGSDAELLSERLAFANAALRAAGHNAFDLSQGPDKARFIACLGSAVENIKVELARLKAEAEAKAKADEAAKAAAAAQAPAEPTATPAPTAETSQS